MTTSKTIDLSISAQLAFTGSDAITRNALRFNGTFNPIINCGSQVFSKRLKYADLVYSDPVYTWSLTRGASTPLKENTSTAAKSLAGDALDSLQYVNFVYLRSNVAIAAISSPFIPLLSLPIDTAYCVGGKLNYYMGANVTSGNLYLSWDDGDIGTIGNANFFCDVIIGNQFT